MQRGTFDSSSSGFDMAALIDDTVEQILTVPDFGALVDWLEARLVDNPESLGLPDTSIARGLAHNLGRAIWNATPLPTNDWRPRPLPAPGRNDPCPCGSGAKFKQCCANLPTIPTIPTDEIWPAVIESLSPAELDQVLAAKRLPLGCMASAAYGLMDDDRVEDAVRLLEAVFKPPYARLDERLIDAVDALADAYMEIGATERRSEWLHALTEEAPRVLRTEAATRLATIYSDLDEYGKAWEYFRLAQRLEPDAPNLPLLEITLLASEGRLDEASDRARFWEKRLAHRDDVPPTVIEFLRAAAKDPIRGIGSFSPPHVVRLTPNEAV